MILWHLKFILHSDRKRVRMLPEVECNDRDMAEFTSCKKFSEKVCILLRSDLCGDVIECFIKH